MKKILFSATLIAFIYVLFLGYDNRYHWLLQPKGAIMAAIDVSPNVADLTEKEPLWMGVTPEIGVFLLRHVDLSVKQSFSGVEYSWLHFCLNLYHRSYEKNDPDRARRFFEVAQYLVDAGFDVNNRPPHGFTPLEGALLAADFQVFSFLVKNGADTSMRLTMKNREGMSLLEFARQLRAKNISGKEGAIDLDKIVRHLELSL